MQPRIVLAVVASALLWSPGVGFAEPAPSLERLVVEMADSPAEHAAVAKHFRAKAEDARGEASKHESMGRVYGGGKLGSKFVKAFACVV